MLHDFRLRFVRFSLRLSLLLLATAAALAGTVGSPGTIKRAVADSGIYQAAADILSDQPAAKEVPAVRPELEVAVNTSFPPNEIQDAADQVVDGTYNWLEGESQKPDFKVDLTPVVSQFTSAIGEATAKQAQDLPVCGPEQLQQLSESKLTGGDLLGFGCLPPGVTAAMVGDQAVGHLKAANQLLREPTLSADTFPTNADGQTVFESANTAPATYQFVIIAPWLLAVLALACAGLLVWMNRTAMAGFYDIATSLALIGIVLIVLAGISHIIFIIMTQPGGSITQSAAGSFQQYIIAFVRSMEAVWFKHLIIVSSAYALVGGAAVVALRMRMSAGAHKQHTGTALDANSDLVNPEGSGDADAITGPASDELQTDANSRADPKAPGLPDLINRAPTPDLAPPGSTIKPKDQD